MAAVSGQRGRATCDIAYGTDTRPIHASSPWDAARFEVHAHRVADLSEGDFGVAVFNSDRYGHAFSGGAVGITLLRSPPLPRFRLGLYPHAAPYPVGHVQQWSDAFSQPSLMNPGNGLATWDDEQWFLWEGPVSEWTAIKHAEEEET